MPSFSGSSLGNLASCHSDLQRIAHEAINFADFAVICGHRGEDEQNRAFILGKSKLAWPNSRHNSLPSEAMDLVPFPVNWNDSMRFHQLAGVIKTIAQQFGIEIEWGGECFGTFKDLPHFQLKRMTIV